MCKYPTNTIVMVVEDNQSNRELMCRRLEKYGIQVLAEVSAIHALETLEQRHPDLILLDLSMPGMDGWSLATRLKARPETGDIPIIAVTAWAMPGDRQKALAAGCDEYLTKPVDFKLLLKTMTAVLESGQLKRFSE